MQQSYTTREDNVFHLRIYLMQTIENSPLGGRFSGFPQAEYRAIQSHLSQLEKYRSDHEEKLIAKYSQHSKCKSSGGTSSVGIKALSFKIFSKLHKINVAFLGKLQVYFPRLYELIFTDQLQANSAMKDACSSLLSAPGLTIGKVFAIMAKFARARYAKEITKLATYAMNYNSTLAQERSKTNKNEKFFSDKYLQGSEAFAYIAMLQKKYFLRSKPIYKILINRKGNQNSLSIPSSSITASAVHRKSVMCPISHSEDILNVEKKKTNTDATLTSTTTTTTMNQSGGGTTSTINNQTNSSASYTKEHESIFEVILCNYDKHMKEWKLSNKFVGFKIRAYTASRNNAVTAVPKSSHNANEEAKGKVQANSTNNNRNLQSSILFPLGGTMRNTITNRSMMNLLNQQ